jgi:Fe-S cluster biosynthesis and repair protein YggX
MSIIQCSRCGKEKEAVEKTAFYQGEVRIKLLAHACRDCWTDWVRMQIMLINEYRLNLQDPKTDEFLNAQVLAFFHLSDTGSVAEVQYVPQQP